MASSDNLSPSSTDGYQTNSYYSTEPEPSTLRSRPSPVIQPSGRAHESRKLLEHILDQLDRRSKPPPLFKVFSNVQVASNETSLGVFVDTVKNNINIRDKRRNTKQSAHAEQADDDTDDELDQVFVTDATYDLMLQLKDVMMMSVVQGWHIFDEEYG